MTRHVAAVLLLPLALSAADLTNSPALDLARQLNKAFIEVADKVSPSVVVIKVAQKSRPDALDDPESPFWDLVPPEFREQFEKEREKRRKRTEDGEETTKRTPEFNGQ